VKRSSDQRRNASARIHFRLLATYNKEIAGKVQLQTFNKYSCKLFAESILNQGTVEGEITGTKSN
jgi:hypothetical protein